MSLGLTCDAFIDISFPKLRVFTCKGICVTDSLLVRMHVQCPLLVRIVINDNIAITAAGVLNLAQGRCVRLVDSTNCPGVKSAEMYEKTRRKSLVHFEYSHSPTLF